MRILLLALVLTPGWGQTANGVVLSNDAWPRATTLKEWTGDVMRIAGVERASETAQGRAFFEWLRLFSRMAVGGMIQAYEGPRGKEVYVLDAHKTLFVYGWGYCDTTSRIAEAAWQEWKEDAKAAERVITQHADGGYHTMYRLRMDGRYGAFDPRYGYYLVEKDAAGARILDWGEVHGRFLENRGYTHRSRPYFEVGGVEWERALLIEPGWFDTETAWRAAGAPKEHVFGDGAYRMGTKFHDMTFALRKGMTVTRYWDNGARKFYVPEGAHTKREWPFLKSGRFYRVTDASHGGNWVKNDPNYARVKAYAQTVPAGEGYPAELEGGKTIGQAYGVIEYEGEAAGEIRSPYVLVDGTVEGAGVEYRTQAAKPRQAGEQDEWSAWRTAGAVDVAGRYRLEMRGGSRVKARLYFENGMMSIPPLEAGRNQMRLRMAGAGGLAGRITVEYRYETAGGERVVKKALGREDFRGGEAVFVLDAPGLVRCKSVALKY